MSKKRATKDQQTTKNNIFNMLIGQRATIQKCEAAKERLSENVVDHSIHASFDYKIDSNTLIFPVCFYVIHLS